MSKDACRKCKALMIIALLSVAEGRRLQANIAVAPENQPRGAGASHTYDDAAEEAPPSQKQLSEEILTNEFNALLSGPAFQNFAARFVKEVGSKTVDDEALLEWSARIAEDMNKMMHDEDDSEDHVGRVAEQMEQLLTNEQFQNKAAQIAKEVHFATMKDPEFQEFAKDISAQMEPTIEAEGSGDDEHDERQAVAQQHASFVPQLVELLMVDPALKQTAKALVEEIEAAPQFQEQLQELNVADTQLETELSSPEEAQLAAEQVEAILADPEFHGKLKQLLQQVSASGISNQELPEATKALLSQSEESAAFRFGFAGRGRTIGQGPMKTSPSVSMRMADGTVNEEANGATNEEQMPTITSGKSLKAMVLAMRNAMPRSSGPEMGLRKFSKKFPVDGPLLFVVALWYFGNYFFNISNKIALTQTGGAAGFPITMATTQLGVGVLYALFLWLVPDGRERPKITFEDYVKTLPLGFNHACAHSASVFALGAGAVSFAQIVKASEPAFAAVIGTLMYGVKLSTARWLALVPVIAGVTLASFGELNFAVGALVAASLANFFGAIRVNENKKAMTTPGLKDRIGSVGNQYALTTINAFLFAFPMMLLLEGKKLGQFVSLMKTDPAFFKHVITSGLWYYIYSECAVLVTAKTGPVSQSVLNTAKRVIVIIVVALVMQEGLGFLKLLGSGIGIGGVFLYSIIDKLIDYRKEREIKLKLIAEGTD